MFFCRIIFTALIRVVISVAPILSTSYAQRILLNHQSTIQNLLPCQEAQCSADGLGEFVFPVSSSWFDKEIRVSTLKKARSIWSSSPNCTQEFGSINDRLCVYTHTGVMDQGSISIFTTPGLAKSLTELHAFQGCPKDDDICQDLIASSHVNQNSGAWITAEIPGKGVGMLAARDLKPGDLVTAYTPTFMAYLESELSTADRESWWRRAIDELPQSRREAFLNLTYVFGDPRVRVQDIVKANTFSIEIDGVNHLAIFPETSRLNHACNPNAQYVIHEDLLSHIVRVTRPIAAGEEITIAYTSPLEPLSARQAHLQQGFHFTCTCTRCTSPSDSEAILSRISTLQSHLNDWSASSPASPAMAEELLRLHRQEGLQGFMDVAYGFAALAYNAVGDTDRAVEYARLAREAVLNKDGRGTRNGEIWKEVLRDPRAHWSFRRRG